ncbi:LuxR C-terminal-related transcriptional regulator [Oscillospiraceae bacterium OttesenSCG-928-F05]|nr:LuxR C-terminal-related transcriptional regulator [Oscillospiraceae bacterium OttesenSCG-928-F05]
MKTLGLLEDKRVVYLQAPAGYGKTVTAGLWLELYGGPRAALTLDVYNNQLADFCHGVCQSLLAADPQNQALLRYATHPAFDDAPDEFTNRAMTTLHPDLRACLVLDDLHHITDAQILRYLPAIFRRLPEHVQVLVLSRNEPPESLAEMVLKEELTVITADSLRFSTEEIFAYFSACGCPVSWREAERVYVFTEGWPIGVAAVFLSGDALPEEKLPDGYLGGYIEKHIWDRWDARTRDFMLKTAFEEEVTPELCHALTGDDACGELLESLHAENAFVSSDQTGKYRFHRLFRTFLLKLWEKETPSFRGEQQRKAGEWYLKQRDFYRAADRFAACGDDDGVARCFDFLEEMERSSFAVEKIVPIVRKTLNDRVAEKYPFLNYMRAYAALNEGRAEDMFAYADSYYANYPRIVARNPELAHNIFFLKIFDFRMGLFALAQSVQGMNNPPEMRGVRGSATLHMPLLHRSIRDFSELAEAEDIGENLGYFETVFGDLLGDECDLWVSTLAAGLYYERGELTTAHSLALTANAALRETFAPESKFCAMMIFAQILRAQWHYDRAELLLEDVREMIEREGAYALKGNMLAYLYRCKLENGDGQTAEKWISEYGTDPFEPVYLFRLYSHFTTAQAHIVLENYDKAIVILKKIIALCTAFQRPLDVIEAHVLSAIAFWKKRRGHQREAMEHMEAAVLSAHRYGYVQVFANEGPDVATMLYKIQSSAIRKSYTGEIPGTFAKKLHMLAMGQAKHTRGMTGRHRDENVRYTDQQKRVMRLLCEGNSYRQIAEEMGIKFSTVRSHVELIYKKLDVPNETEAVLKIKELGLLDE